MSRPRAMLKGRSIIALDVLGEVRRSMKILRRVEKYLVQQARRDAASAHRASERGKQLVQQARRAAERRDDDFTAAGEP